MRERRKPLLGLLAAVIATSAIAWWTLERHYSKPTSSPVVAEPPEPETIRKYREELQAKLGKKLYSYHDEETLIRDFFQDERDGFFVDVGTSHYEQLSNTYYLEKNLGWSGVGIDAQEKYAADYRRYRPRTKFLVYFVGDRESSGKQIEFFVDLENEFASSAIDAAIVRPSKKVMVPSITLDELLDREGVKKVDFLSMDIEDSEPGALAGFSLARWKPRLLCVEMHTRVKQQVLRHFKANGYVPLSSYAQLDWLNGYFVPEDSAGARRDAERFRALNAEFAKEMAAKGRDAGSSLGPPKGADHDHDHGHDHGAR